MPGGLEMDRLPDHYFQAVGSGTGAIWMGDVERFRVTGDSDSHPRLQLRRISFGRW
jgi:hypothetical protein